MGLRFRRRLTIFPGLRLNFTGSGISATLGVPGANININKDGLMHTLGAPGTGIHYRGKRTKWSELFNDNSSDSFDDNENGQELFLWQCEENEIRTDINNLTSNNLIPLRTFFINSLEQKKVLIAEKTKKSETRKNLKLLQVIGSVFIVGIPFYWFFSKRIIDLDNEITTINSLLDISGINLDIDEQSFFEDKWNEFVNYFNKYIMATEAIWDVTHSKTNSYQEQIAQRINATETVNRIKVRFRLKNAPIVNLSIKVPYFENSNGDDLYILPGFILIYRNNLDIDLIDFKNIHLEHGFTNFAENEGVVSDTEVIGKTYTYVNKNGSPDRRFSNNPEIPICLYSDLIISSDTGLNELYQFSNPNVVENFVDIFNQLKSSLHENILVDMGDE